MERTAAPLLALAALVAHTHVSRTQRELAADPRTKKTYGDAAYRGILSGRFEHMGFEEWWRENYLGWLRFRVGEEGRLPPIGPGAGARGLPGGA